MRYKRSVGSLIISTVFLLLCGSFALSEGSGDTGPINAIRVKSGRVLSIIHDPALQSPADLSKVRRLLTDELEPLFNFHEMAIRALGTNAHDLTAAQADAFTEVFKRLLSRVCIDQLTAYLRKSDDPYRLEDIQIVDQELRGKFARVHTQATVLENGETSQSPLNFRMIQLARRWFVYDLEIKGVSIIENYRSQFDQVLKEHSFEYLLQSITKNVESLDQEQSAPSGLRNEK